MKDPQYTNNKLLENVTPIGEDYEFEDFSFYKNYDDYKRNTKCVFLIFNELIGKMSITLLDKY